MSTRNITRVILDGEIKADQYCHYDGYPSSRGTIFLTFLSQMARDNQTEELKTLLRSSTLFNEDIDELTDELEQRFERAEAIERKVSIYEGMDSLHYSRILDEMLAAGRITLDDAKIVVARSSTIGNEILPFILHNKVDDMIFCTDNYCREVGPVGDWQIEGGYTLDLDTNQAAVNYHGYQYTFDLSTLAQMTEEEIQNEMNNFEEIVNTESELRIKKWLEGRKAALSHQEPPLLEQTFG